MRDKKSSKQYPQESGERGTGPRPMFRPRVVVKLHDWVDVPYDEEAVEVLIHKYGPGPLEVLDDLRFIPQYTSVSPDRLEEMMREAVERDPSYDPPNLLTWFTVDVPMQVEPESLQKLLLRWEPIESAFLDGPATDPAFPTLAPADDPRWANQGYLDPAPDGIDAEFAWTQGFDGVGVRFVDLEQGWTLNHEDLNAQGASLIFGTLVNTSRPHGTAVLGEVVAVDNAVGCVGIASNIGSVDVVSHSGSLSNVPDAIIAAVDTMNFGDILLLEVQDGGNGAVTIETRDDSYEAIRLATALGIVVIEAAGNGSIDLDAYTNAMGQQILNPTSPDYRDSGAIIVGAATSTTPHQRMWFSNFGARVDCYAWGENVESSSSNTVGSTTLYTTTFNGTSSASPIVTGAAILVQNANENANGYRLSPAQMRAVLSDPTLNTASANPGTDLIGVMPDLANIIQTWMGVPDAYIRDNPSDIGDPHAGSISASPDIILRPSVVPDPQMAFGQGSGTENSTTLGYEVTAGQDNVIYVRLRNRGPVAASNVDVTVYWSPVSTLVTPDVWNEIGTVNFASVPAGDILTVSNALTWQQADIPAPGHYCIVGVVDAADDPAPPLTDLSTFDNFRTFIRNNNNVTWRNFNVVTSVTPGDPSALPFQIGGFPEQAVPMALDLIGRLPRGAIVYLDAPLFVLEMLRIQAPIRRINEEKMGRVRLTVNGIRRIGEMRFPAGFRAKLRLSVQLPEVDGTLGYEVAVRQVAFDEEDGEVEVGRVTWYLAGRDFEERRKRLEACLFELG
jgi:serine protease